jgi:hypothetical protein
MQRPENYGFLVLLILIGIILMLAVGITGHQWARRVILRGRYLVLKIAMPPLLFGLVTVFFVVVAAGFTALYQSFYGYQVQPGEAYGPLGDDGNAGGIIGILLLLFGVIFFAGYALYLIFLFLRAHRPKFQTRPLQKSK